MKPDTQALLAQHPCYTETAREDAGRMHLAVAPQCNLGCRYCERALGARADRVGGPGSAARVLTPAEAAARVDELYGEGWLRVVGIAGPGEPLANAATMETFRLIHGRHPGLILCMSTNGLLLGSDLPDLLEAGLCSLTITINTTSRETAVRLYGWAAVGEHRLCGPEAAEEVLERQWSGLVAAAEAGLLLKINSVLIPGLNEADLEAVARRAAAFGAHRHNIVPLIPRGRMRSWRVPTLEELEHVRLRCEQWIPQFRGCTQCRADAVVPPARTKGGLPCGAHV